MSLIPVKKIPDPYPISAALVILTAYSSNCPLPYTIWTISQPNIRTPTVIGINKIAR